MKTVTVSIPGIVSSLLAAILAAAPLTGAAREVEVQPSEVRGTWQAWGCSLCWWAKVFGDRDDLADLLFTTRKVKLNGSELPGLGMNFARYNAGACSTNEVDGRKMVASKTIKPYRQIEGFWLDGKSPDPASASWDWSVDEKQRAMLLKAKKRGANHFELFSNSPMWWMCANRNPSGAADATDDNLRPEHYTDFAIYLATVAQQAKKRWGITFTTLEPFNEPVSRWWYANGKQEGCHFSRKAQEAFLPILWSELGKSGLRDLPIAASDENTYDEAVDTWKSFKPAVKRLVAQINVHGYQNGNGRRDGLFELARKDGKRLWNTEYGDDNADGLEMARNLHLDFQYLRPTAWAYWQPFDGGGWGLVDTDFSNNALGNVNPKYFVLAHYTRHIRPGMRIIESGSDRVVAAHDPAARRIALVILNDGPARKLTFDLTRFNTERAVAARWLTEPKGSVRYEFRRDIKLDRGRLECTLPADSVQTVEVRNLGR